MNIEDENEYMADQIKKHQRLHDKGECFSKIIGVIESQRNKHKLTKLEILCILISVSQNMITSEIE